MNLGTLIVGAILAAIVILDIRYLMRKGVNSCGCGCENCHGACKWTKDLKQAKAEIARKNQKSLRKSV